MVPSWADQLLLQLWMEQFDTLPIQCRHIEHMHEGVGFRKNNFLQNYSYENLDNFSLIRLLNMHRWCLLNLTVQGFSLNLTVWGVSIKHCLLTFFIFFATSDYSRIKKYFKLINKGQSITLLKLKKCLKII